MMSRLKDLSGADKATVIVFAVLLTAGAVVAEATVGTLHRGDAHAHWMNPSHIWFITAGTVGAIAARLMAERWFGTEGSTGWLSAVIGCLVVTILAGVIGGTLALPFFGTMFGPMMMAVVLFSQPALGLLWIAALLLSHLSSRLRRSERDCRFGRLNQSAPV